MPGPKPKISRRRAAKRIQRKFRAKVRGVGTAAAGAAVAVNAPAQLPRQPRLDAALIAPGFHSLSGRCGLAASLASSPLADPPLQLQPRPLPPPPPLPSAEIVLSDLWKVRPDRTECAAPGWWSVPAWTLVAALLAPDACFALGGGAPLLGRPVRRPTLGANCGPNDRLRAELLSTGCRDADRTARRTLRAMAADCSMPKVRFLGWLLSKAWRWLFREVRVSTEGAHRLRALCSKTSESPVVLLPTHRSHIDYLLMSYILFGLGLDVPHIAAGDNLDLPVVGRLLRGAGAFFIRRASRGDRAYNVVLDAYITSALQGGATVEFFVQGGRSRNGIVGAPKLGLLGGVVSAVARGDVRDVALLPVAVDYERVPVVEQVAYSNHLLGRPKNPESLVGLLRGVFRMVPSLFSLRDGQLGNVHVRLAASLSVREHLDRAETSVAKLCSGADVTSSEFKRAVVRRATSELGRALVEGQRRVSSITPSALLAAALLGGEGSGASLPSREGASVRTLSPLVRSMLRLLCAMGEGGRIPSMDARDVASVATSLEPGEREADALTSRALKVLRPMLARRGRGPLLAAQGLRAASSECVDKLAATRLALRYCCAELLPLLADVSAIAAALSAGSVSSHLSVNDLAPGEGWVPYWTVLQRFVAARTAVHTALFPGVDAPCTTDMRTKAALALSALEGSYAIEVRRFPPMDATHGCGRETIAVRAHNCALLRCLHTLIAPIIDARWCAETVRNAWGVSCNGSLHALTLAYIRAMLTSGTCCFPEALSSDLVNAASAPASGGHGENKWLDFLPSVRLNDTAAVVCRVDCGPEAHAQSLDAAALIGMR